MSLVINLTKKIKIRIKMVVNKSLETKLELYLILKQLQAIFWVMLNRKLFSSKMKLIDIIFSLFHYETKFAKV